MVKRTDRRLSSNKIEYVKVEINIPKQIVDFVRALAEFSGFDFEWFWQRELIDTIKSIIECISGPYVDSEWLIRRYNLEEILKDC